MKKIYAFICFALLCMASYAENKNSSSIQDEMTMSASIYTEIFQEIRTTYRGNILKITGLHTTATIGIYNLLGKKVADLKQVIINGNYAKVIDLPKNNIYIVKITSPIFNKAFKIVAK